MKTGWWDAPLALWDLTEAISIHSFTYFQATDQGRFLLKRPRNSPPNRRKLTYLSFTTWLSSTNQNPTTIQACNRRNDKAFQLTDIFPFTSQCPREYTRFFHNYHYLIFYHPNGKTLFELFASPYIIHYIHEYHHPWHPVVESQYLHFPSAIHLI